MLVLALIGVLAIGFIFVVIIASAMKCMDSIDKSPNKTMLDRFNHRAVRETEQSLYKNAYLPLIKGIVYLGGIILLLIFTMIFGKL